MEPRNYLLICVIVLLVQLVRYFDAIEKLDEKGNTKDNQNFTAFKNELEDVYTIDGEDAQIVPGFKEERIEQNDPVYKEYEMHLRRRNIKIELLKSYMLSPLEMMLYGFFIVNVMCSLGQYVYDNFDDPAIGIKQFVEECHRYWIGSLFLGIILLYRIVSKKIEDITYVQALKYKVGFKKGEKEE